MDGVNVVLIGILLLPGQACTRTRNAPAARDSGRERPALELFSVRTDAGRCSARVERYGGGCKVGPELEVVELAEKFDLREEGTGEQQLVACEGQVSLCGVPYQCRCSETGQPP
jgi:hypothetical protein